mgnify:CR=1 FL=1
MTTLSIVIPAYNEEEAIADIIRRCLAERENIVRETTVEDVEIPVVNDGSHDRTAEIAANSGTWFLFPMRKTAGTAPPSKFIHEIRTCFPDLSRPPGFYDPPAPITPY